MKSYQGSREYIAFCYSVKDRNAAETIAAKLNDERIRVWSTQRGCCVKRRDELERLAEARTVLILVSKNWLADETCKMQVRAATELGKQLVMLFLNGVDLMQHEDVRMMLGRDVRMIDYLPESAWVCWKELMELEAVTDCKMDLDEKPDTKRTGWFS